MPGQAKLLLTVIKDMKPGNCYYFYMDALHINFNFRNTKWPAWLIIITVLITAISGCATDLPQTPGYYTIDLDAQVPEINKIALVTDLTPPEIESVDLGFTQGEGAASGILAGGLYGAGYSFALLGPGYFLVLPIFVAAGVAGGAAEGIAGGYSADMLAEAEAKVQHILDSAYLQTVLLEDIKEYGLANTDFEFIRVPDADQKALREVPDYTALLNDSIDAVLEVDLLSFSLKKIGEKKRSQFIVEARIRLVSAYNGSVLSDFFYRTASSSHTADEWIANDAALLTQEIQQAIKKTASDIIDENFLLFYPDIPDNMTMSFWGMSTTPYILNPVYPEFEWLSYVDVDTLQPTLKWEQFPREYDRIDADGKSHDITHISYELRIITPGGSDPAYFVSDIHEPFYKIENELKPCSHYLWSVRARFKRDGRTRITEWAAAYNAPGFNSKPWNLRRGKGYPSGSIYYRFKTPCDSKKTPETESPVQDDDF